MKINYKYLGIAIVSLIIFFLISRKYFFLSTLTIVAAYTKYIRAKSRLPIVIEPVFFFSILLTRVYGLGYGLGLVLFCGLSIDLITGSISQSTIISISVLSALNAIAVFFTSFNILVFGLIVSILNMVFSFGLSVLMRVPPDKLILMPITNFFFNISYFLTFSEILERLML